MVLREAHAEAVDPSEDAEAVDPSEEAEAVDPREEAEAVGTHEEAEALGPREEVDVRNSESMIQALYYDFVANYVKTRMYSTRYDAAGAFEKVTIT